MAAGAIESFCANCADLLYPIDPEMQCTGSTAAMVRESTSRRHGLQGKIRLLSTLPRLNALLVLEQQQIQMFCVYLINIYHTQTHTQVHIDAGKEDCYHQYVQAGATFYVSFSVSRQ